MSELEAAATLQALLQRDIPECRTNLEGSYANLERVAAFCEANYLQANDKRAALEETKRYTVQSLASVAYQINTLASNLLQMLELQAEKLEEMETQVGNIAEIVDIHKEKVARREIGILTTNKTINRQHKIVQPATQEKPQRYNRQKINFEKLDDIGHGVKLQPRVPALVTRTGSTASQNSSGSSQGAGAYPIHGIYQQEQQQRYGSVSSRTSSKDYRTPIAIPQPNQEFLQPYPGLVQTNQYAPQSQRIGTANYTQVQVPAGPNQFQNIEPTYGMYGVKQMPLAQQHLQQKPAAYRMSMDQESLPPPPAEFGIDFGRESPPLPPPPMMDDDYPPPPPIMGRYSNVPNGTPLNYIEKVVALYDYQAEKADELSFQENQIIFVVKKNDDGWFEGVLDGVTGLFPGNYVEPCI